MMNHLNVNENQIIITFKFIHGPGMEPWGRKWRPWCEVRDREREKKSKLQKKKHSSFRLIIFLHGSVQHAQRDSFCKCPCQINVINSRFLGTAVIMLQVPSVILDFNKSEASKRSLYHNTYSMFRMLPPVKDWNKVQTSYMFTASLACDISWGENLADVSTMFMLQRFALLTSARWAAAAQLLNIMGTKDKLGVWRFILWWLNHELMREWKLFC